MATSALDERLITVSIEIGGQLKKFDQRFAIVASGQKFADAQQNEAHVKIANLTKEDRDFLLTATSPFNKDRTSKKLIIEAGRISTGTSKIYEGEISTVVPSEPPDIWVEMKCQTGQFLKGKILATSHPAQTKLSAIVAQIAKDTNLNLNFQAEDRNVSNFSHTGSALHGINKINEIGGVHAFQDNEQLVVKNLNVPLTGTLRIVNKNSGMIGIPCFTELGVRVKMLMDKETTLGGALEVKSEIYPTTDGRYMIYKLGFEIASRDEPFYWIADCLRVSDSGGAVVPSNIKKQKKARKHK